MEPRSPTDAGRDPVETMLATDAASRAMGMRLLDHGLGWARIAMTVREDMTNGHGSAHGGMIFTLADTAFACACNSWGPSEVASGCEITFIAPAGTGDELVARAVERTRFGRRSVCDVTVTRLVPDGTDVVVAELRGHSQQVRPPG